MRPGEQKKRPSERRRHKSRALRTSMQFVMSRKITRLWNYEIVEGWRVPNKPGIHYHLPHPHRREVKFPLHWIARERSIHVALSPLPLPLSSFSAPTACRGGFTKGAKKELFDTSYIHIRKDPKIQRNSEMYTVLDRKYPKISPNFIQFQVDFAGMEF